MILSVNQPLSRYPEQRPQFKTTAPGDVASFATPNREDSLSLLYRWDLGSYKCSGQTGARKNIVYIWRSGL